MVKIKHFQYWTILETDFLSNEGENNLRRKKFSPKLEKPGMHSLRTGRILEIYFARNERKSHVNFCQSPVYIFTKHPSLSLVAPPLALSLSIQ